MEMVPPGFGGGPRSDARACCVPRMVERSAPHAVDLLPAAVDASGRGVPIRLALQWFAGTIVIAAKVRGASAPTCA